MPTRHILLSLALAYILALVVLAPAHLVQGPLTDAGLRFDRIEGSLWAGRLSGVRLPAGELERLDWRLEAMPLLRGALGAQLEGEGKALRLRGSLEAGWFGGFRLRDLEGRADLGAWGRAAGLPTPIAGTLNAAISEAALDAQGRWQAGAGELHVDGLAFGGVTGLGLRATLDAADGALLAHIEDTGGPLGVKGEMQLLPALDYHLALDLSAREAEGVKLLRQAQLLGLGITEEGGRIVLDGRWGQAPVIQ